MFNSTKALLILMFLSLASTGIFAQEPQGKHTFLQPAHTFSQKMTWWDSIYLYPEFKTGHITYFTGFTPERDLRLNYNLYFGQIDMIDERGDTVQIAPSKTFRSISIGHDVFLFHQKEGYMRVLIDGAITLAERTFFHLEKVVYVSGNSSTGATNLDYDVRGRPSNYDRYYAQNSTFYFVDSDGRPYPTSRAILKKLLPEFNSAILDFAKKHATNFSKEADLLQITQYGNSLRRIPSDNSPGMVVPANGRITIALGDSLYRFKGFQDGVVVYQDGRQRDYKLALNYNLITGEMEAIENGDTVRLNNSGFITTVNVDGTTYFRKPDGYVEILLSGRAQLGVVRRLSLAHAQAAAASSKYGPDEAYDPSVADRDQVNFDRMFTRKDKYYMIDGRGNVYEPSITSMRRLYPHAEKQLNEYVRLYQPDFHREEDLKAIVSYLAEIQIK